MFQWFINLFKGRPLRPYREILQAPPSYWDAPQNVHDSLCNGAGPSGLPSWVVPDTMYGLSITEAANIHDWMYVWGETYDDKENADSTFLLNMIKIINHRTTRFPLLGWFLCWLRHRRALKYYEAVLVMGDKAFDAARGVRPVGYVITADYCLLPPPGWRCTRNRGHPGPCAAIPEGNPNGPPI